MNARPAIATFCLFLGAIGLAGSLPCSSPDSPEGSQSEPVGGNCQDETGVHATSKASTPARADGTVAVHAVNLLDGQPMHPAAGWIPEEERALGHEYSLDTTRGHYTLRITAPDRAMEWSRRLTPSLDVPEWPILLVRYRAERLRTDSQDYGIFLQDRRAPAGGFPAVSQSEFIADGKPHEIRVNLFEYKPHHAISHIRLRIHSGKEGNGVLHVEGMGFIAPAQGQEEPLYSLIGKIGYEDGAASRQASDELIERGDKATVDALVAVLGDKVNQRNNVASRILATIGGEYVVDRLMVAAQDGEPPAQRSAAIEALGRIGNRRSTGPVVQALGSSANRNLREISAWALGEIGGPRSVEPLVRALGDEDEHVGQQAAVSLSRIGGDRVTEAMATALESNENYRVRVCALRYLNDTDRAGALGRAVAKLQDASPMVRAQAAHQLAAIDQPGSADILVSLLRDDPNGYVRAAAACALGKKHDVTFMGFLVTALEDPYSRVRLEATKGLGELDDIRAIPALVTALTDSAPEVRMVAAETLSELEWSPETRSERVRYSLAKLMWGAAEKEAQFARSQDALPVIAKGYIELDVPVLLGLEEHTGWRKKRGEERGRDASVPWIEFSVAEGELVATMELGCWSGPKARFAAKVSLLDQDGTTAAHSKAVFETSGEVVTLAHWELHSVHFAFGPWDHLPAVTTFQAMVEESPPK